MFYWDFCIELFDYLIGSVYISVDTRVRITTESAPRQPARLVTTFFCRHYAVKKSIIDYGRAEHKNNAVDRTRTCKALRPRCLANTPLSIRFYGINRSCEIRTHISGFGDRYATITPKTYTGAMGIEPIFLGSEPSALTIMLNAQRHRWDSNPRNNGFADRGLKPLTYDAIILSHGSSGNRTRTHGVKTRCATVTLWSNNHLDTIDFFFARFNIEINSSTSLLVRVANALSQPSLTTSSTFPLPRGLT